MFYLKNHYLTIVEKDLILTDNIVSSSKIPKLKKVTISIGGSHIEKNYILAALFILDFISNQKPILTCKQIAKVRYVVGGKVTLRKNLMYSFLFKILFEILPRIKQFDGFKYPSHVNTFTFNINDIFVFTGLSYLYNLIDFSHKIQIQIQFTTVDKLQLIQVGRSLLFCFPRS